ncbi:hypothetical protein PanWU01x14_265420, partial [Parasponia andersonii]
MGADMAVVVQDPAVAVLVRGETTRGNGRNLFAMDGKVRTDDQDLWIPVPNKEGPRAHLPPPLSLSLLSPPSPETSLSLSSPLPLGRSPAAPPTAAIRAAHCLASLRLTATKLRHPSSPLAAACVAEKHHRSRLELFRKFGHRRRFRCPFGLKLVPLDSYRRKDHQGAGPPWGPPQAVVCPSSLPASTRHAARKLRRPSPAAVEACSPKNIIFGRLKLFVTGDDSGHHSTSNWSRWIRLVARIIKLVFRKRTIEGLELVPDPSGNRQRYPEDSIA